MNGSWAEFLSRITLRFPLPISVRIRLVDSGRPSLVVLLVTRCVHTGETIDVRTEELLPPSEHIDEDIAARLVRGAVLRMLEHELDETLCLDGSRLVDPHVVINADCSVCGVGHVVAAIDRKARTFRCCPRFGPRVHESRTHSLLPPESR